jgi:hypothetical protein
MELAILMWFAIGAGIAAGAFVIARSAIQIGAVAYGVIEKTLDTRTATWQTLGLSLAIIAGVIATAIIAGYAILTLFGSLLQSSPTPLQ